MPINASRPHCVNSWVGRYRCIRRGSADQENIIMQSTDTLTIEQRLQQLEALEQIRQLKHRYLNACDRKAVEDIRECFALGPIRIDYGELGVFHDRDSFIELYTRLACQPNVIDLHHGSNPEIVLESATEARGRWALYYFNLDAQSGITRQLG